MKDYAPLRSYVSKRGGLRLAAHPSMRDMIVGICVEEFPSQCHGERCMEVLRARVRMRLRRKYGSIMAAILVVALANFTACIVWEWWTLRDSHRVLISGWQKRAKETQAGETS